MSRAIVIMDSNQVTGGLLDASPALSAFKQERFVRGSSLESVSIRSLDLIIHLGSDLSLVDGPTSDFLKAEANLMATSIEYGLPVLGICFGAQMMSLVLGGQVTQMPQPEIGWTSVYSTSETGLLGGEWFQWHYDSFSFPKGVEKLAENSTCPQGFRTGRSLATQFHPELDESVLDHWLETGGSDELSGIGISLTEIIDQTRSRIGDARRRFDRLLEWFLKTV